MRSDPNPLFRKIIMPWYDSTFVCWILLLCMTGLVLFSLAGIMVARGNPAFHRYQWVPWALFFPCLYVGLSVAFRMIRRYQLQHRDQDEL